MQSILQFRRMQRKAAETSSSSDKPADSEQNIRASEIDIDNPQNWSRAKKCVLMMIISAIAFIVGFGSSIDSAVIPQASKDFHVSEVAESLATGLYLIGFGIGAPFAGPLSETYGRNPVYLTTFTLFCCWILGAALAPNFGAQLVFRFLAGVCGSTPFTTAGGTLADIFDHHVRFMIFPYFAFIAFLGPMMGPIVGGYIGTAGLSWRWVEWVTLCISGGILVAMVLFLPETYAPVVSRWSPRESNAEDQGLPEVSLGSKLAQALSRPFQILFTEPIVIIFTLYLTLVYMVAFSFFSSAPFIFGKTYGFSQGGSYLMFVSIAIGLLLCALATPLFGLLVGRDTAKAAAKGKANAEPETMLWWAMVGGPCLPISLFWMAWSSYDTVSYWSPLISAAFFGFSMLSIFISTYAYLIQRFTKVAASALVGITLVRYVAGGSMVLISIPMFQNLGNHYALTILAAISCAFTPVPYILYISAYRREREKERVDEVTQA